ncbi:MAG: tRNA1(Val) (adenine(37)-N6)-methyltransferase [Desulfobacterales bacterium]|nr:tRNA1(Val) (adenine(37)-N6)-methyltransferase [Desulfobacterales bacterium]MDX2511934.1 tRNA1(Val) (adenine(37)-N6)-methyltransferase [Desulfobacterales bacterium]
MQHRLTRDTFFNGKVSVIQERAGYRFSIDAVILAHHVRPKPGERVVDLGTGCGIVPLIVAYRHPAVHMFGIEVQKELADIANDNVRDNGMQETVRIVHRDMQTLQQAMFQGPVDIVVSNPPFRKVHSGRVNPNRQRAVARHEISVTLPDVVKTAGDILKTAGLFVLIYTSERLPELVQHMKSCRLEPKNVRFIHSRRDSESKLMMMEGIKQGRPGLKVGPPIVIYNEDGSYTGEVGAMFFPV